MGTNKTKRHNKNITVGIRNMMNGYLNIVVK